MSQLIPNWYDLLIRDAKGKRKDDPDYDPKTLYIPDGFKSNQTPVGILLKGKKKH